MLKEQSCKQLSDNNLIDKNKASTKDTKAFSKLSKDGAFDGPKGSESTRYGEREINGRILNF